MSSQARHSASLLPGTRRSTKAFAISVDRRCFSTDDEMRNDPLENGLVASLARPGGNVTGLASQSAELIGKRVELLREAVPKVSRVAVLLNPDNPGTPPTLKALDAAGRAQGIEIQRVEFRNVGDLDKAFRSVATGGATAVLVQDDPHALVARIQIAEFALRHRLPTVAGVPEAAQAGALIAYGGRRKD
jgi:putative ABC transport system substrate-binding protein